MHLTNTSTKAYLGHAETEVKDLKATIGQLQSQAGHLEEQVVHYYNTQVDLRQRLNEATLANEALETLQERQDLSHKQQAAELSAAQRAAREMGDMLGAVLSAEDFANEATEAATNLADLMQRNEYQANELMELRKELDDVKDHYCFQEYGDILETLGEPSSPAPCSRSGTYA